MPFDITQFSPAARAKQIAIGRQFGSRATKAQAEQTLSGYASHGPKLAKYGFTLADATRLGDALDLLIEAGVGRDVVRGEKSSSTQASYDAMNRARNARSRGRSILEAVEQDLEEQGLEGLARDVATVLRQTATAGELADDMASQLDLLTRMLERADIKPIAAPRGGADALVELTQSLTALRQSQRDTATRPGTVEETQYLDQIDGIIVRLVRRARKAALAAARALQDPALAEAFKLDKLYRRRNSSDAPEDEIPEPV